MKRAIYPGSFDPITLGHLDIVKRISKYFDELIILVANSTSKKYLFSLEERANLISASLSGLKNVRVDHSSGLTVDYAKANNVEIIIRGLRAVADFEYEMSVANMNKKLYSEIETMIIFSDPKYNFVSSRMIKEVGKLGGDLSGLVPPPVLKALKEKYT